MREQTAVFRYARPTPPYWTVRFDVAVPPSAGTFVLADLGGPLREVLFPSVVDGEGFAVMVPPRHPAARLLPGARVAMLGPLGRGFRVEGVERLLLVAEAAYVPHLWPLMEVAPEVAMVMEAPTRALLPPPGRFPPTVELFLVTLDGSTGYLGPLESEDESPEGLARVGPRLRELVAWAECVCLACTPTRYGALGALVREVRLHPRPDFAQALVVRALPCGVGACEVCRIATRHGERRVCTDGPVFDLMELGGEG